MSMLPIVSAEQYAADRWPSATAGTVTVTQADGFVVCSWWKNVGSVPPYTGEYQYEWFPTSDAAYECHRLYEEGEFSRATAIGVFAAKGGMPTGGRVL